MIFAPFMRILLLACGAWALLAAFVWLFSGAMTEVLKR